MGRIRRRVWHVVGTMLLMTWVLLALPAAARDVVVTHDDVRFQRYGVEDGLSQTSVRAMLQDEAGYVWLGTQDGLNRFDGYEFRVYRSDPQQPDSMPDNHITTLERSRRGGFWVGTLAGGLGRYLPEADAFVRYAADGSAGSLASNAINIVRETPDGTVWVAGSAGELQWLAPGSERFQSVSPKLRARIGPVTAIEPMGDRLLLGSATGLWLLRADGQRAEPWGDADARYAVESIEIAVTGDVWVGTREHGVLRFAPAGALLAQWQRADGLGSDLVTDLQFDAGGCLWIATFDGLSRLDARVPDASLSTWRFGSGLAGTLASSRIHSLMLGRDDLLWAGSWLNGVSLHVPQSRAFAEIQVRPAGAGGPGVAVHAVEIDRDGTLWLGVAESLGLVHYSPGRGLLGQYRHRPGDPTSLPSSRVTDVLSDHRGRLWVATWDGLARKDGDAFVTYQHDPADPDSLSENRVHRLYEDHAGTLWVGTSNGALAALCDGCDRFRNYRLGAGGAMVEAMFEDSRGDFWVGGRTGGLYRLDRDSGHFENFRSHAGEAGYLSHDSVTAIIEDRRGRLWVGTQGGGVNRVAIGADGVPDFVGYGIREGLAAPAVGGLAEDAKGRIWISTTAGISRLDPASGRITNFDAAAGAQIMGYFVGAFDRFDDGAIAFGGMQGVTIFHPVDVHPLPSPDGVTLTEMSVLRADSDGSSAPVPVRLSGSDPGHLSLPPGANDIDIEFAALSYAAPDLLRYAYRLEGLNEDWVEVDANRRRISYNNLQPGPYTLRVRARARQGGWSEDLVVPIRLQSAWWQSALAKLAYLLGLMLLLAGIAWAVRQRRDEREVNQREIADSEQRLKLALWGTGDELWDWDITGGQLRRQNPLDRPDADTDEVVERADRLSEWVHPDDQTRFEQALVGHEAGSDDSMEVSYRVCNREGEWRWRLSRGRVVARDAAGRPLRVVGTNSDITRIKENELELARINAELESRVQQRTLALHDTNESLRSTIDELRQTQQQLVESEKMAALGGLVAGVAHEINTPLGVSVTAASYLDQEARSLAQQLDAGTLAPAALEQFRATAVQSSQLILHNLRRADRMIRSFKQVAVDQSSEESRRIELRGYLEEIMISLQPSLRRHEVVIDCPPGIEFETYPGAIYQIVSNLAMNSVMHGFSEDTAGRIRIAVQVRDDHAVLRYEDDGVGMEAEACRRVFDPFFTTRRGDGGSGLGMHITWNLATQVLGGTIGCESAPGQGARFVLRIPMQGVPVQGVVPRPPSPG